MGGESRDRKRTITNRDSSRPHTQGHYFSLPNAVFYLGLKPGELAVYAYLLFCENRATYQCYPSYSTIGRAVGMSKNTASKHVQGLEAKKLITTEPTYIRTKDGQKRNGNLLYTIRPIQEAMDFWNEAQGSQAKARTDTRERGPPGLFERGFGRSGGWTPPTGKSAFLGQIRGSSREPPESQNSPQKAGGITAFWQGRASIASGYTPNAGAG